MRVRRWTAVRVVIAAFALLVAPVSTGCTHRDPPQWDAGGANLAVVALPSSMQGAASTPLAIDAATSDGATPLGDASSAIDAGEEDAGALPQTHDEPQPSGPR